MAAAPSSATLPGAGTLATTRPPTDANCWSDPATWRSMVIEVIASVLMKPAKLVAELPAT